MDERDLSESGHQSLPIHNSYTSSVPATRLADHSAPLSTQETQDYWISSGFLPAKIVLAEAERERERERETHTHTHTHSRWMSKYVSDVSSRLRLKQNHFLSQLPLHQVSVLTRDFMSAEVVYVKE